MTQIDKMASIYKGAISCLVLDAELMATKLTLLGSRKLAPLSHARIAYSVWMSRSWTIQEGQLPPNIAIQFLDVQVVLSSERGWIHSQLKESVTMNTSRKGKGTDNADGFDMLADQEAGTIMLENIDVAPQVTQSRELAHSDTGCVGTALRNRLFSTFLGRTTGFVHAWNKLSGRSKSMSASADIPVLITNMLDLENGDLLTGETHEKFQAILLSLDKIPLPLFFNMGLRHAPYGDHQNRWIPVGISTAVLSDMCSLSVFPSRVS